MIHLVDFVNEKYPDTATASRSMAECEMEGARSAMLSISPEAAVERTSRVETPLNTWLYIDTS